jgi:hypothetical protein
MKGNMKNDMNNKLLIISVLILIPIGILYFNMGDELFNMKENLANNQGGVYRPRIVKPSAADTISGIITPTTATDTSNPPASVSGSNFVNVCHPKKSNFYNINVEALDEVASKEGISANSCKYECDIGDCDLYLMNKDVCKLYKKKADADMDANFLEVNCNNKVLPSTDPSNPDGPTYTWAGEGKIDSEFYKGHKKNFKHINYLLDTANDIKEDYIKINSKIIELKNDPESISPDRGKLRSLYDAVNLKLENAADYLDLSRNSLYSNFVSNKYSMQETDTINLGGKDLSKTEMLREFKKQKEDSLNIEGRTINDTLVHDRKYLVYAILSILMALSVAILIIFKMAPDLISDKIVISYFMGVLLLLFFIHYFFKV